MNVPITRLFVLVVVLFGLLVAFTSRWSVFEADALRDNANNRRPLIEDQKIRRGSIRAADGTTLARSRRTRADTFTRIYPTSNLFSHAVGYSFISVGRAGLERARNDDLTGRTGELGSTIDQLLGRRREGDDLRTALDPRAQQTALDLLRGAGDGRGSVVALEPKTGAVRVMASTPDYDPNDVGNRRRFAQLNREEGSPLFNRATQAGYPPGSTFKVVTAAAALDSGAYTPDSVVNGDSPKKISGVPLANFGDESFGDITLTTALTNSVNTVWAQVAEDLGKRTMKTYMERFGFDRRPPLDYPADQRKASGEYARGCGGRLLDPTSPAVDVGRMAIGQDKLCVTPLQMAMVAAGVANGGELVKPHMTEKVVDRDGRTVETIEPEPVDRVMKASTAKDLNSMMQSVVNEGSGTAAALAGIDVAGKTGTAEIDPARNINQPWFIGFAPAGDPEIAIAVTVERTVGGTGGTVAGPIFKQVAQELLR